MITVWRVPHKKTRTRMNRQAGRQAGTPPHHHTTPHHTTPHHTTPHHTTPHHTTPHHTTPHHTTPHTLTLVSFTVMEHLPNSLVVVARPASRHNAVGVASEPLLLLLRVPKLEVRLAVAVAPIGGKGMPRDVIKIGFGVTLSCAHVGSELRIIGDKAVDDGDHLSVRTGFRRAPNVSAVPRRQGQNRASHLACRRRWD
jgi:hypothetical protein